MLRSDIPPEEKTSERLAKERYVLAAAGGNTIAAAMAVTFYHVIANPSILASLRVELSGLARLFT